MTIEKFLSKINPKAGWKMKDQANYIRDFKGRCPIQHVANSNLPGIYKTGITIGLKDNDIRDIVDASDNYTHKIALNVLRDKIIKACFPKT